MTDNGGVTKRKSLSWIKTRAKKIKREQGIKHNEALEVAAKEDGFESYQDARAQLEVKSCGSNPSQK